MAADVIRCPGCGVNMDLSGFSIRPEQVVCPRCHTRSVVPPLFYPMVNAPSMAPASAEPYVRYTPEYRPYEQAPATVVPQSQGGIAAPVMGFSQPVVQPIQQPYYAPQSYFAYAPSQMYEPVQPLAQQFDPAYGVPDPRAVSCSSAHVSSYQPLSTLQSEPFGMHSDPVPAQQMAYATPFTNEAYQQDMLYSAQIPHGSNTEHLQQPPLSFNQPGFTTDRFERNNECLQPSGGSAFMEDEFYPPSEGGGVALNEVQEAASAIEPIMPLTDAFDLFDSVVDTDFVDMVESEISDSDDDEPSLIDAAICEKGQVDTIPDEADSEIAVLANEQNMQIDAPSYIASAEEGKDLSADDFIAEDQINACTLLTPTDEQEMQTDSSFETSFTEEEGDLFVDGPIIEEQISACEEVVAAERGKNLPADDLIAEEQISAREEDAAIEEQTDLSGLSVTPVVELQAHEFLESETALDSPQQEAFLLPIDKSGNTEPFAFALIGFVSTITMIPLLGVTLCIVALALSYQEKKRNLYNAYRGATLFFAIIGLIVNAAFLLFQIILMISLATAPVALIGMFY